ncbi:MAG: hypothetical protein ACI901_001806 [Octadecabacter sp.]|jgi:hypothetical protein
MIRKVLLEVHVNIHFSVYTALALSIIPPISFAQSCTYEEVYQEFSLDDTFNSSGSPLDSAYAVFQQDRFYVNQQNRLNPNDKPDSVMTNREARATYGQAVRDYLNANSMGQLPAQALIGTQYVVRIEACGSQENPSIQIVSMSVEGEIEDDSWELELEYRTAELDESEQRLNQREAVLDEWERQLSEWERRLSDLQNNMEQQAASTNDIGSTFISGVPDTMLFQAGGACSSLIGQAIEQSSELVISVYTNRNGVWSARVLGTDACRQNSSLQSMCKDFEGTADIVEVSTDPVVLQQQTPNCISIQEFAVTSGAGQHVSTNTEVLCPRLHNIMPEATRNVIQCQ